MKETSIIPCYNPKIHLLPGLRPGPRWGSLRRSPRPPSRLGRAILPKPLPLGAFGDSTSKRRLRRLCKKLCMRAWPPHPLFYPRTTTASDVIKYSLVI